MAISCDPQSLLTQAKCFPCIPRGLSASVKTYLLCQWATKPTGPPPDAPTATNPTNNFGYSIIANWTAPGAGPVPTGYKLSWNGGAYVDVGNVLSFNVTGLTPGAAYFYTVKAYNAAGDSPASNLINVTAFQPSDIPGMALWLDAQVNTSFNGGGILDGQNVSSWDDQSGGANNATYTGNPDPPVYRSALLNGKPTVSFDGVAGLVTAFFGPNLPLSAFAVYQAQADAVNKIWVANGSAFFYANTGGPSGNSISLTYGDGVGGFCDAGEVLPDNVPCLVEMIHPGVAGCQFYLNGANKPPVVLDTGYGAGFGGAVMDIGNLDDAGTFGMIGWISEIFVFSTTVSAPQRVQLEGYLNIKWALGF